MFLAGLWFGNKEPDMNLFMKPFVGEANSLSTNGVSYIRNGQKESCRFFPLGCIVDSIARPMLLNIIQFNGYFGCSFCYHPGNLVSDQIRYPCSETIYSLRTDESMLKDMKTAFKKQLIYKGIKGPSILMNLNDFKLVSGTRPDYMHCVLLGVVKYVTELFFTKVGSHFILESHNN